MVLLQNWHFFFHVNILAYIGQENVFYDVLERKHDSIRSNKTSSGSSAQMDVVLCVGS